MKLKNFRGAMLLLIASFMWGTAFVAQSMGNTIGPFTFIAARNIVGFIFLLLVILVSDQIKPNKKGKYKNKLYIKGGIICGVVLFGAMSFQQIGLQHTSAGKAGFLTALYIVIVPIFSIFLRKKAGLKIWVSVAIATAGAYLLSVTDGLNIEQGDICVIVSAVIFSVHILLIDKYSPKTDAIRLSAVQFLVCALICLAISIIVEKPVFSEIIAVTGPILYAGVMSSGIAFTLQVIGQKDTQPAVASLIMSLESVFAVLAGGVILNEVLSTRELVGCVLVFVAVILAQIPSFSRKKELT